MNILHLTLTRKWFDMIASGEKREEYREMKPYWQKRLAEEYRPDAIFRPKQYDIVRFKNGYAKDAPTMDVEFFGTDLKRGKPEWGAVHGKVYFTINLGEVLSISNY